MATDADDMTRAMVSRQLDPSRALATKITNLSTTVTPAGPWSKELVRAIAMDIGKAAVHHLEIMYPAAIAACPATMKLSLRNSVHNEIMAAIEVNDEGRIVARLKRRKEHRRKIKAAYMKIRAE
jgi:hypothetical protein